MRVEDRQDLPHSPLELNEDSLRQYLEAKGNVNKAFLGLQKQLNQRKSLILIAAFDESGRVIGYLGMHSDWLGFEDESMPQNPKIFKTYTAIMNRLERARKEEIGIKMWQKPGDYPNVARFGLDRHVLENFKF